MQLVLTILNIFTIWVSYTTLGGKNSRLSGRRPSYAIWGKLFRLHRCRFCLFFLSIGSFLALFRRLSSIIELFVDLQSWVKELLIVICFEFLWGED